MVQCTWTSSARQDERCARGKIDLDEVASAVPFQRRGEEARLFVVHTVVAAKGRLVAVERNTVLASLVDADAIV